jgi:hypothetical protein
MASAAFYLGAPIQRETEDSRLFKVVPG